MQRQQASVVALSGDYILQIGVCPIGRRADDALLGPLTEAARVAVGNVTKTSERFGDCEWLTAADADGFLDKSTLTPEGGRRASLWKILTAPTPSCGCGTSFSI